MTRRRHNRPGRTTPPRRPRNFTSRRQEVPELMQGLWPPDDPLTILARASSVLEVTRSSRSSPFEPQPAGPDRDELIDSFIDTRMPPITALLAAMVPLVDGEDRRRIKAELARRRDRLPTWLTELESTEVTAVRVTEHVLGDGENITIELTLPDGQALSVAAYIDHNLGTVLKDGFVVDESLVELEKSFRQASNNDPHTTMRDLDRAEARARIEAADELAEMTVPRYETETWPVCRPLLMWAVGLLPEGGSAPERPEFDETELELIVEQFLASSEAEALGTLDTDEVLPILWFATDYGTGDPYRWSPVAVEIFLTSWAPRKLMFPAEDLELLPDVLRAFIAYAHRIKGIGPELTAETSDAVDHWLPDFLDQIDPDDDPDIAFGPGADEVPEEILELMLERLHQEGLDIDRDGLVTLLGGREGYDSSAYLRQQVHDRIGGEEAVGDLDTTPLPDEPFDWTDIPGDIAPRVGAVLERLDRSCDELFDIEVRTVCRRVLARVASADPGIFRRKSSDAGAAAALAWIVAKLNDLYHPATARSISVGDHMTWFGVSGGTGSQRANVMLKALAGGHRPPFFAYEAALGDPDLLTSATRQRILDQLDRLAGK